MATSRLIVLLLAAISATAFAQPGPSNHMCQLFQTEKNDELQWLPDTLPASHFQLNFRVIALADVNIVLAENPEKKEGRITITLGANKNSLSRIRHLFVQNGVAQQNGKATPTPAELKCDRFNEFWLQFDPRSVKVGRVGEMFPFLEYGIDSNSAIVPKFVGFGTSHNSVGVFSFGEFEEHGPRFNEKVFITDKGYCYDWTLRPWPTSGKVCFQVKSEGIAALALSPERDPPAGTLVYEMELGFSNNQLTVLRRGMHGGNIAVESTPDILDCDEFRTFCLEASGPHITLTALGDPKPILDYVDEERPEVMYQYIGFAGGYDFKVSWRWPEDMVPDYEIPKGKCKVHSLNRTTF